MLASNTILCQTETLDIFQYTPPSGWTRTPKDGAVVFTKINKTTSAFGVMTVYGATASSGDAQRDFAAKWKDLVVTPLKGEANPDTNVQTTADGWKATSGGSLIEFNGIKAYAILSVTSGFGKAAGILTIFTDQSFLVDMQAFVDGVKFIKNTAPSAPISSPANQVDPFPNRPGRNGQKPLSGTLKPNITMADLAGNWDIGAGSVLTYVDSSTGDYSHTSTSFYGEQYVIKADGSFAYKFTGRANNDTTRESDSGNVAMSGSFITFKFKTRAARRFQFIAFMTQPNGASILSLVPAKEGSQGMDAAGIDQLCSHGSGYIHCVGGEEWARLGVGAAASSVQANSPANAPIEHWSILREYQDNQLAADAKYGGKRVMIIGEMDFVLVENGKPVVRMSVPAWSGRQMFCEFPLAQKTAVAQLKPNQKVVMECTFLGIAGGVSKVGRVDLGSSVGRLTLNDCALR